METRSVKGRGFALIEIVMVLLPLTVLIGVSGHVLIVSLRAWNSGCTRAGILGDISHAVERTVADLDAMAKGSLSQYDSGDGGIDHTIQYEDLSGNTYVLYLYNANDTTLDSAYSESSYDLLKADLAQGDVPGSGEGELILKDLVSPDSAARGTDLTVHETHLVLDLAVQRYDETVRLRTQIRPRNL